MKDQKQLLRIKTYIFNIFHLYSKSDIFAVLIIFLTAILALGWISYTGFLEDDAFITFRFARQIAEGNGFVYNQGQPIYGTTTPFFTLLLALCLKLFSIDITFIARLIGVFALVGTQYFVWRTLRVLGRSTAEQRFVLATILFSSKMIYMSINGMEIPLITFLMALSWFTFSKRKYFLTGIICGFLLFIRIDLLFWPIILVLFTLINNKKGAINLILGGVIIYLPWIIFATLYFGSPIPYTVTAKWVAYSQFNKSPYLQQLKVIVEYISPFDMMDLYTFLGPMIILPIIGWAIWKKSILKEKLFLILWVFAGEETLRLVITRATFFTRYLIPLLWTILILFGCGLGLLWMQLKGKRYAKTAYILLLVLALAGVIFTEIDFSTYVRDRQVNRYENSLKQVGLWLYENTPVSSTVLLEPLGYVGYYSQRTMIDEVGLVTPEVVALKRQGVGSDQYLAIFEPDYAVLHCDDADIQLSFNDSYLTSQYTMMQEYNPLNFESGIDYQFIDPKRLIRNSCYQIWEANYH